MPVPEMFSVRELLAAGFVVFLIRRILSLMRPNRPLPPGPRGWPILGCLPLMGPAPHVTLAQMAKKFGPIMFLKMGSRGMVIASTPDAARAFLKTMDLSFSNRPTNAGATHIAYGAQDLVFADLGPRWKCLRKLCSLHMLGAKSFKEWASIREAEAAHMVRDLCKMSRRQEPVPVSETVLCAIANMIGQKTMSRRVFETRGRESGEFKEMMVEVMRLSGSFSIGDFIPAIAWMDVQGIGAKMKDLHKKFDALLTKMLEEHSLTAGEREENPDFVDIVAANTEYSDGLKLTETQIKALLLNFFIAGTDTSATTVQWALAEMLKNPNILKHVQMEMDQVIGKDRRLQESDIPNLPYLRAICKETFRMHPVVPLSLPRVATISCEVNGYHVPKDARLLINLWAIGRDPGAWNDNPLKFNPDKFLSEKIANIEPWGNDFELTPFGAGRRICVGIRMGVAVVEYMLGTLVHSFEWRLPNEVIELNMDEKFGLVLQKAESLYAIASPRLAPSAY
ncbi:flavonoid 3',5'-hydroxylase 1-like [Malania oleifera]|uniref:flavonoid 3',5'-hydroxylase 1-like n=1 Tax=Malania oleifera TaxID=397392 RepID=UPI0025AE5B07|nr:flavonoid 3',5'-hydroxylase 1-like [Malania oleifera]